MKDNNSSPKLSEKNQLKLEVIQLLSEPCDRKTYQERLKASAKQLRVSTRTVQRMVNNWEEKGLSMFDSHPRPHTGTFRCGKEWQDFVIKTYEDGCKDGKQITPVDVSVKVNIRARELRLKVFPSLSVVYRILKPVIKSS